LRVQNQQLKKQWEIKVLQLKRAQQDISGKQQDLVTLKGENERYDDRLMS
jgi:hypothetical protein